MNLSSLLLNDFETHILNKSFGQVRIGKCFLKNSPLIRQTYAHFAQAIDYSNNILEKVRLLFDCLSNASFKKTPLIELWFC